MTRTARNTVSTMGGVGMTLLLFLFLITGAVFHETPDKRLMHGAVRLSSFEETPAQDEEVYSTKDVPQVQRMEEIAAAEMSLEQPKLEMEVASLNMDMAPEFAGSLPMSGMPSLSQAGALSAPSGGAFTLGEVDEQPRALYAPSPLYPSREKAQGKEAKVLVRITLRRDGTVMEALPLGATDATAPFLDAAVSAVLQWRFVPCKKGGEAVQCIADQPFTFTIPR